MNKGRNVAKVGHPPLKPAILFVNNDLIKNFKPEIWHIIKNVHLWGLHEIIPRKSTGLVSNHFSILLFMLIVYVCLCVLFLGRMLPWLAAYLSVVTRR